MSEDTVTIELDGKPYETRKNAMIIEVADQAGVAIPRFCYHKKLTVAANCRMCLVEVEKAPKPLPACATPVQDGMKVFTKSALATGAQKAVMEFLLINHPLDCPICDQGGECELQDVAMGYGRDVSRFQERKRVVADKNLGPLIATDMTRCIHCTRCVRFGEEIGGMPELGATGRGEHMQIGTFIERALESELSGNIIDLCPVGALTSKPFRFQARAWEMNQFDSVAPHDGIGSNVHLHISRERVMRVVPRENEEVNEVWLSDRDRFSYQGLYSDNRLDAPMLKRDGVWANVDWETALQAAVTGLQKVRAERGAEQIGALLSPSATVEECFLLQKVVRGLGSHNVDHRLRQRDFSAQDDAVAAPQLGVSLASLEQADLIVLVGANVREEHPLVNHRIRKAVQAGGKLLVINGFDHAFNYTVAGKLIVSPSRFEGALSALAEACNVSGVHDDSGLELPEVFASALSAAKQGVLLLGPSALHHPQASAIEDIAHALTAGSGLSLGKLCEGANAAGAWLAGALPHRGPGNAGLAQEGLSAKDMVEQQLSAYILHGIEPELDCAHSAAALAAVHGAEFVVSLCAYENAHAQQYADVILPIALFGETSGTYVNLEGRWQSFEGAVPAHGQARPAWKILRVLGNMLELSDFEYMDSASVRDEVKALCEQTATPTPSKRTRERASGGGDDGVLWRLGEVPMYACDPLVRNAAALQSTPRAAAQGAKINSTLASKLGLQEGARVLVRQDDAEITLDVAFDERVADDCVLIHAGRDDSVGLGESIGPLTLQPS